MAIITLQTDTVSNFFNKINSNFSYLDNKKVNTEMITDLQVTTSKINNSAVTTEKINNGAVTTEKINGNAVTSDKINDGAILLSKINLNAMKELISLTHPIGSLYWSSQATDPSTLFGGTTWKRVKDKFILAAGDTYSAGSVGGSATETHNHFTGVCFDGVNTWVTHSNDLPDNRIVTKQRALIQMADKTTDLMRESSTYNTETDKMPPYVTYYCWERTA